MKVAYFQFFPPTLWTPGGGEVQLAKTRAALSRLGIDIELLNMWNPPREHDILHVFGSTYQLSDLVVTARRLGQRVVVSPIIFTTKPRWTWIAGRMISSACPLPTIYTYRKRIYDAAHILLPGSGVEARQLHQNFGVPYSKMEVIPVGVEDRFLSAQPDLFQSKHGFRNFVLTVARINHRKGHRKLIKALDGSGIPLLFIGNMDPDDPEYFDAFLSDCRQSVDAHYLGSVEHEGGMLDSAYAACRVHALPSVGEFPGIVNMEAALAGATVVAGAAEPVYETLGENAFYCRPSSVPDIRRAVLNAFRAEKSPALRERLRAGFLWPQIAERISQVYDTLKN